MTDSKTRYETRDFDCKKVSVICDDCLKPVTLKRAGHYNFVALITCECGFREMGASKYSFEVGPKGKIFLSEIMELSKRLPHSYGNHTEFEVHRLLIQYDTSVLLEDDDDIKLFLWATNHGSLLYEELEHKSMRLMSLYDEFKDVKHPNDVSVSKDRKKKRKDAHGHDAS